MKRLIVLALCLIVAIQSWAATQPSYSSKFGDAMAGVIQQKAAARGFASNDPRFVATEAAIGTLLTGVATGLAAAAGAPLWATIAIGAVTAADSGLRRHQIRRCDRSVWCSRAAFPTCLVFVFAALLKMGFPKDKAWARIGEAERARRQASEAERGRYEVK